MTQILSLIFMGLAISCQAAAPAADGPQILLPKGASASWLLKPEEGKLPKGVRFAVDSKGRAFLLPHSQILRLPGGEAIPLKEECRDLYLSFNDKLYLLSDRAAGPAQLKDPDEDKRSWARVKEKLLLPGPGWRLAETSGTGMLAYGFNPDTSRFEAYRLSDRRKLMDSADRIQAMAGDGDALVAALPGRLLRLSEGGKPESMRGPSESVTHLASLPGLGLAAAHPSGISLLRPGKKPLPLLAAAFPKIRSSGTDLYVMLREGGILKISGLDRLKDLP